LPAGRDILPPPRGVAGLWAFTKAAAAEIF